MSTNNQLVHELLLQNIITYSNLMAFGNKNLIDKYLNKLNHDIQNHLDIANIVLSIANIMSFYDLYEDNYDLKTYAQPEENILVYIIHHSNDIHYLDTYEFLIANNVLHRHRHLNNQLFHHKYQSNLNIAFLQYEYNSNEYNMSN